MKVIALTRGEVTLVDDADYEYLVRYKWWLLSSKTRIAPWKYAVRQIRIDGKKTTIYMHHVIMNAKPVDHIDRNGLNNQRDNLRPASEHQNQGNRIGWTNKRSSRYKGVFPEKHKWYAAIAGMRIGVFDTEAQAAMAYNAAAIEYFGKEFAKENVV